MADTKRGFPAITDFSRGELTQLLERARLQKAHAQEAIMLEIMR